MAIHYVSANAMSFGYLESGPADGPLALCLHGFPDSAQAWRYLLPVLGAAGYHAVAPWLRGYAPSDLAPDANYQVGALASDCNALHDALGGDADAVILGHDWGALAVYGAVAHQPQRWRKAVTAAVPPPAATANNFFTFDQLKRSWYTFFFQMSFAPIAIGLDDYVFYDRLWADWSPGYDGADDLIAVKEAIGDPERMLAAISYYRFLYQGELQDPALAEEQTASLAPTPIPTLYLHGDGDGCLALEAIGDPLSLLAPGSRQEIVAGAGHFLLVEQPEIVNQLIVDFLAAD